MRSGKALLTLTTTTLTLINLNTNALGVGLANQPEVRDIKNQVELKYGSSIWRTASENQPVRPGSEIRTGSMSRVELLYPDGTITRVGSRTVMKVLDRKGREIEIRSGNLWFKVTKHSYGLKIYAPKAIASITGTEGGVKVELLEEKKVEKGQKEDISVVKKEGIPSLVNDEENKKIPPAQVMVAVTEGTVSTKVRNKTYNLKEGDQLSFSTISSKPAELVNVGDTKIREMFESATQKNSIEEKLSNITNSVTSGISMAKQLSLKENMSLLQKMLDMYSLDSGGLYPDDISAVLEEAKSKGYYKSFKNPFNARSGIGPNGSLMNYSDFNAKTLGGIVLYEPSGCNQNASTGGKLCSQYKIYGSNLGGKLLEYRGQVFSLSNK